MSAREDVKARVQAKVEAARALPASERIANTLHATHTTREAEQLLAEFRAEAVAERDAEIMRWLGKKAREHLATGRKADRERADLITALASQISRGAVRPNNTLLPAGIKPEFFEPGRTYLYARMQWKFRCDAVTTHPDTGKRVALGYSGFGPSDWQTSDLSEGVWADGDWTEVTEGGDAR
jgi:hypothetical protein